MTIMSEACAERCSIMRLVDTRWAGVAKGVGTQPITGRVHLVQIQIEKDFLASSFAIMADQPMDMLLGLDVMKRHQVRPRLCVCGCVCVSQSVFIHLYLLLPSKILSSVEYQDGLPFKDDLSSGLSVFSLEGVVLGRPVVLLLSSSHFLCCEKE